MNICSVSALDLPSPKALELILDNSSSDKGCVDMIAGGGLFQSSM